MANLAPLPQQQQETQQHQPQRNGHHASTVANTSESPATKPAFTPTYQSPYKSAAIVSSPFSSDQRSGISARQFGKTSFAATKPTIASAIRHENIRSSSTGDLSPTKPHVVSSVRKQDSENPLSQVLQPSTKYLSRHSSSSTGGEVECTSPTSPNRSLSPSSPSPPHSAGRISGSPVPPTSPLHHKELVQRHKNWFQSFSKNKVATPPGQQPPQSLSPQPSRSGLNY